ncbi:MAG TPA: regulatory protein RecX [Vicinamibacterales bacterium]|nr:regulatory protein RecX [Vicinamibacterales bacterium]
MSEAQLRARLTRRNLDDEDIESAVSRLKGDGTLNDRRVALALARMESTIKSRGRARVLQKIRQAGIDSDTADQAVREVFADVDEDALLEHALDRRLRGKGVADLDDKARARIVRGLVAQGFRLDAILKRLRS